MEFSFHWIIQNPVQAIDSGVKVIFDSEPILAAITIVTFIIVAFFVWNKNKVKLYKYAKDRTPMKVEVDMIGLKEELARAKVQAPPQEVQKGRTQVETEPPKERSRQEMDGVSDTDKVEDEILTMIEQHPDLLQKVKERIEMRKPPEDEVRLKTKIDKRKTPEFKARLLENLRKARERKKSERDEKKRNATKVDDNTQA